MVVCKEVVDNVMTERSDADNWAVVLRKSHAFLSTVGR